MRTDFNKILHQYNFEAQLDVDKTGKKKKRIVGIINAESGLMARSNLAAFGFYGDRLTSFSAAK